MDSDYTKAALGMCLTGLGMIGLANGVEYSGWVLFVGLCAAFSSL